MSVLKSSITAVALVVGLTTLANAAPRHQDTMGRMATPYANSATLPYGDFEGRSVSVLPYGAAADDANTRAAEAFQDHFNNN